jgi:addiction module RelE/StbE family toxin
MAYKLEIADSISEKLRKFVKKDSTTYNRLLKAFHRIQENPHGVGKWMHGEYAFVREIHISHFVLKYTINDKDKVVTIVDYDHHA